MVCSVVGLRGLLQCLRMDAVFGFRGLGFRALGVRGVQVQVQGFRD